MLLVHLFVCFVRVSFLSFSLPHGVGGWLRFVIVALPGLFINVFVYDSLVAICRERADLVAFHFILCYT